MLSLTASGEEHMCPFHWFWAWLCDLFCSLGRWSVPYHLLPLSLATDLNWSLGCYQKWCKQRLKMRSCDWVCPSAFLLVPWEEHVPVNSLVQRGEETYQADIDPTNSMKSSPTDPSLNQQNHSGSAVVSGGWERISDYFSKLLNLVSFVMEEKLTDKEPKQSQSKSLHY